MGRKIFLEFIKFLHVHALRHIKKNFQQCLFAKRALLVLGLFFGRGAVEKCGCDYLGFVFQYHTGPGSEEGQSNVNSLTIQLSGLRSGTRYYIQVQPLRNGLEFGQPSTVVEATTRNIRC